MKFYLDSKERRTIKNILDSISTTNNWKEQIDLLFEKFFNPKIQQKKIFDNIQLIPPIKDSDQTIIKKLEGKDLIEFFEKQKKVIPKPICVLAYLHQEEIPNNKLQYLLDKYHQSTSSKLKNTILKFGLIDKTLTLKEIAPLIFLLYNNNISRIHGKFSVDIELKRTIDRINYSFVDKNPGTLGTKDQDAALSGWYLAQANNKLGLPIWNNKINKTPYYYIKNNGVEDIENAILRTIKKDSVNSKKGFKAFEIAFEKNSRILFKFNSYYSTKRSRQRVRDLFNLEK